MSKDQDLSFVSIYSKHSEDSINEILIKEKNHSCFYNCYLYLLLWCCCLEEQE